MRPLSRRAVLTLGAVGLGWLASGAGLGAKPPKPHPTPRPKVTPVPSMSMSPSVPPSSDPYPPDTTLTNRVPPTIPAVPALLAKVNDPSWGTHITRVSDVDERRHAYARTSAWNSDQTKILLGYTFPGRMLNGSTYADLGSFSQISGAVWANTDPNKIYGVSSSSNIFYEQNATTGTNTPLHTFDGYSTTSFGGWGGVSLGDGEGCISNDDKTVVLMTQTTGGVDQGVLVYDIDLDEIVAELSFGTSTRPDNAHTTQSGNYVVVKWNATGTGAQEGGWLYDRNLNVIRQLWTNTPHGDPGYDSAGNEVMVYTATGLKMHRLSDGTVTSLLAHPSAQGNFGHYSCRNLARPGWAYASVYQWDSNDNPGRDQLIAVKLDGSQTVEVFGFSNHRSNTYQEQPHAVPNRDGTKVMFASEWGVPGTVYAYVAEI